MVTTGQKAEGIKWAGRKSPVMSRAQYAELIVGGCPECANKAWGAPAINGSSGDLERWLITCHACGNEIDVLIMETTAPR